MKFLPFNQGNLKTQLGVAVVLGLFFTALALPRCAKADESYSQVGIGSTVIRGPAPVLDLQFVYPDAGPKDARVEVGATFIGSSTFEGKFQQNNFAISSAMVDSLGPVDIGVGASYLQNTDEYNGSHVNFKLILGYRHEKWTVRWNHFSNGGTQAPNRGRDMITVNRVL